jgi:hypothetical protein
VIVGLGHRGRAEGVGLDHVGAGGQVLLVDLAITCGRVSDSSSLLPFTSCSNSAKRAPR